MTRPRVPASIPQAGFGPLGRGFRIVPAEGRSGRSLVVVTAILAFLAALAAGTAAIVATSSAGWRESLGREATIQLKPGAGRETEADLVRAAALARATPGVRTVAVLSRADAERLLEPWLGTGLDLSDLPVPRLIVLGLDPAVRFDIRALADRLRAEIPGASLDDHAVWRSRLALVANTIVALALATVVLVLAASAGAIAFATRGALAGHRDIVEVLHFVGAEDRFVAWTFARRFAALGLAGGLLGAGLATLMLIVFASLAGQTFAEPPTSGNDALLGALSLGWSPYLAIATVALADGVVAGAVTSAHVKRFLNEARRR